MTKGLILSAGFGTRLRPLTDLIPKPLVKVKNKTAIEYVIDMHKKGKVEHIAINLHHKAKEIVDHLGYNYVYSYEPKIQGTAGAIRQLQGWFLFEEDEHFVVSNGDTITNLSLLDMYDFHRKHGKLATRPKGGDDYAQKEKRIFKIIEGSVEVCKGIFSSFSSTVKSWFIKRRKSK